MEPLCLVTSHFMILDGCYYPNSQGHMVNGVAIFGWSDMNSYNSQGVWNNLAIKFEIYDLDICLGHAANGLYHRKLPIL